MPRKTNAARSSTPKNKKPKNLKPEPHKTKKQQQQDDIEARFKNPLLRVAIEPEVKRQEAEPGWTPIDRLRELGSYEGYFERTITAEESSQ